MAASNWDILAFDTDGKSCSGNLIMPDGSSVEIYKNHLCVRNSDQMISTIQHGEVNINGFEIQAIRHEDQHSIFVYATNYDISKCHYFSGIGCYGFGDELTWLKDHNPEEFSKIDPQHLTDNWFCSYSSNDDEKGYEITFYSYTEGVESCSYTFKGPYPGLDNLWVGVSKKTETAFLKWLETVADEKYFEKVKQAKGLRFNQGDAFFAEKLGTDLQATVVGEAKPPVISKMI